MRVTPKAPQQDEVVASKAPEAGAAGLLRGPVQARLAPQAVRRTGTDPLPSDWSRVGGGQMPDVVGASDTGAVCDTQLCKSEFCVTEDCKTRPSYTSDPNQCSTPTVGCPPCS